MNQDPKRLLLDPEMGAALAQFDTHCEGHPFDLQAGLARFESSIAGSPLGSPGVASSAAAAESAAELALPISSGTSVAAGVSTGVVTTLKALLATGALVGAGALAWNYWPGQDAVQDPVQDSAPKTPAAAASSAPSPEASTPAPLATKPSALQAELAIVRQARQALAKNQAAKALSLLQDNQERFANGALVPEREALLIIALHRSGKVQQAKSKARRFLTEHPESPMTNRVRQVLGKKAPRKRR